MTTKRYNTRVNAPERGSAIDYLATRLRENNTKNWNLLRNIAPLGISVLIRDIIRYRPASALPRENAARQ